MKVGRYLLLILAGAIVGGLFGIMIGSSIFKHFTSNLQFANHSTVWIITVIALVINIVLLIALFRVQRTALKFKYKTTENIDDDKADYYENKANTYYLRVNFIYYAIVSVGLINMFIIALGNGKDYDMLLAILPFLVATISGVTIGLFLRKFDSRMPKQGEKNYIDKFFNVMDEGEKHITLVSMYKVYNWNLVMLILGVMFLGIYSLATGINQSLSMFILIIIFMYNAFGYITNVRKFYKN